MDLIIYNKDCVEVMQDMIDNNIKVDLILTDPPYKINLKGGNKSPAGKRVNKLMNKIKHISDGFDYDKIFNMFLKLQAIPNMLIFCSNKQLSSIMKWFEDRNISVTCLVWNKTNPAPLCGSSYIGDIEFVVYVRGKGAVWNNQTPTKIKYKVKRLPFVNHTKRVHPNQKPVEILEEYIQLHSLENNVIFDPFMGSGSTGVACRSLNRQFIGIELDTEYYNIAKERLGLS